MQALYTFTGGGYFLQNLVLSLINLMCLLFYLSPDCIEPSSYWTVTTADHSFE